MLLRLLFELFYARVQLARLGRELELTLVELARTCRDALLDLAGFGADLRLALRQDLFACVELDTRLRRLLLRLHELLLALRKLLLERARFVFRSTRLLLALLERFDQLLVALLRFRARCLDAGFGVRKVFLALGEILDLLLPLPRLARPLFVGLLELVHLHVDELLALGDLRLELGELLLFLERAVELGQALRDLTLALLELRFRRGKRGGARVEPGRLARHVLLQPHFSTGDLDLLVQRRAEALLARQ